MLCKSRTGQYHRAIAKKKRRAKASFVCDRSLSSSDSIANDFQFGKEKKSQFSKYCAKIRYNSFFESNNNKVNLVDCSRQNPMGIILFIYRN